MCRKPPVFVVGSVSSAPLFVLFLLFLLSLPSPLVSVLEWRASRRSRVASGEEGRSKQLTSRRVDRMLEGFLLPLEGVKVAA